MKVAELVAIFSIRPDRRGIDEMSRTFTMMRRAATGLGALFVGGALAKGMVGFNSRMQDAKITIAGMLALAKKTDFSVQVGVANQLYDDLRRKAAELPGETEDYVNMLGMLVQPLADVGATMQQMETVTVNAMVAARGLHESWQKAGRDLSEFINFGKMNQVDTFIRRLLEPMGWTQDRKKELKAMTKEQRLQIALAALTQRQIGQLAEAQKNSLSGQMDKLRDTFKVTLGRIGLPLFNALSRVLEKTNDWLSKNEATVNRVADAIGSGLATAFGAVAAVVKFFAENSDEAQAILRGLITLVGILIGRMMIGWLTFAAPLARVGMIATALWYVFQKLAKFFGNEWVAAVVTVGLGLVLLRMRSLTTATWGWVRSLIAAGAAARAAGAAQGAAQGTSRAGAAVNALSGLALGPAGPVAGGAATRVMRGPGAAGAGLAGAGVLGALGTVGAVVGAGIAIYEVGDMISEALTTDEGRVRAQIAAAAMKKGAFWMDAIRMGTDAKPSEVAAAAAAMNQTNNINININGVKNAEDVTPAMIEAWEKELRHAQVATAGGKR